MFNPSQFDCFLIQIYAVSITIRIVVREVSASNFKVIFYRFCFSLSWTSILTFNRLGLASNLSNQTLLQLGFALLALIWEYDFPPFMVLIIAILNDGNASNLFPILRSMGTNHKTSIFYFFCTYIFKW